MGGHEIPILISENYKIWNLKIILSIKSPIEIESADSAIICKDFTESFTTGFLINSDLIGVFKFAILQRM